MAVASSTTLFCKACGLKVKKKGFLVNKEIYCEMDYKRKFAPRCEECSDFIFGVSNFVISERSELKFYAHFCN